MPKAFTLARVSSALLLSIALNTSANAVILFGAGNSTNLTDPGTGLPFDTVARVESTPGSDGTGGSGVHLGGGYMLTAAHINNAEIASVTFDGSTHYARDLTYIPERIGTTDLKVFKLIGIPTVGAANLYTGSAEVSTGDGYLVGWGRGRVEGSTISTNTVPIAGGGTPLIKRWGTNDPTRSIEDFNYTQSLVTYTYDALETVAGNVLGTGANEAAAAPRDSGSGFFQEIDGTWYLTGLTSVILQQSGGNVTFGNDVPWTGDTPGDYAGFVGTGDPNVFVKISSYATDISLVIPEPSTLLLTLTSALFLLRRRR